MQIFYLAHILCSCMRLYSWGPGDGCRSDTGSETVPRQTFATINFHSLGFIRENLYTAKISTVVPNSC